MFQFVCTAISLRLAVVFLLIIGSTVCAQDSQVEDLTVRGGACFYANPEYDTAVLVEFPYTINRHEFDFFQPDSLSTNYVARIFAQINLYGVDGMPLDSANTYFSSLVGSEEQAKTGGIKLFNNFSLLLKPGVYSARLTVVDVVSKREGEFFYEKIVVDPPVKDVLAVGGRTFAHLISYVGSDAPASDRLVRNGYRIMANPLGIYGTADSVMYFYAELYNLQYDAETPSEFQVDYAVMTESGERQKTLKSVKMVKGGTTAAIAESFDISILPSGNFSLRMIATDLASNQVDTQLTAFWIISPSDVEQLAKTALVSDPCDTLSLETRLHLVHYLLNPVERESLKGLSDAGKERFIAQYWAERDLVSDTPGIKRRELYERYLFSNNFFSVGMENTDGWSTDRGRIFMIYGPWEQRDDIQAPLKGNPFEVWYYHSFREGAVFVFEDKQGFLDYTLVHSNVEGEVYSDYWESRVKYQDYDSEF